MSQQNQTENADLTIVTEDDIARALGQYCVITLDNGDEAFYIHGQFIHSTEGANDDPTLKEIARLSARAECQSLNCIDLAVPEDEEWCWNDIVEQLARRTPSEEVRATVTVTGCETKRGRGVHFCGHSLLSGHNANMWFPVAEAESWFEAVERILVMNGLAENLCRLEPLRKGSDYNDWRAIYNRKVRI
ncbi:hypothetical protein [Pantoea ananatis]|uniref:hypothetical protein n=1 Tax=Pantoea ananas TaxID=553 RepID=UPI0004905554|nr:hypothetical protein [Pantoea ananatis]